MTTHPIRKKNRRYNKSGIARTPAMFVLFVVFIWSCQDKRQPASGQFVTKGIILDVNDLSTVDWPQQANEAGINTIATHITPSQVKEFVESERGQLFLKECEHLGIEVEHELHAIGDLLPRHLFSEDPSMFRMDEHGERKADYNLCVHSEKALSVVCQNLVGYAKVIRPTTGRYFYWIDDGKPMCECSQCSLYSDSEQALILENRMIRTLREEVDPKASLAHLAYQNTLEPPVKVKPEEGIFLEFAPIHRTWDKPISDTAAKQEGQISHGEYLKLLEANLKVFPVETAQVLEYWLDVSLFSRWKKPAVRLPWNRDVFLQDIQTYANHGIQHISSFGVYIDSTYLKKYPDLTFLKEYGEGLNTYPKD